MCVCLHIVLIKNKISDNHFEPAWLHNNMCVLMCNVRMRLYIYLKTESIILPKYLYYLWPACIADEWSETRRLVDYLYFRLLLYICIKLSTRGLHYNIINNYIIQFYIIICTHNWIRNNLHQFIIISYTLCFTTLQYVYTIMYAYRPFNHRFVFVMNKIALKKKNAVNI